MIRIQVLFWCLAASLLPAQASAEADGPDWWTVHGVAADDVLNQRASAGPKAEKVGEIPPGARCVRNMGCEGGLTLDEYGPQMGLHTDGNQMIRWDVRGADGVGPPYLTVLMIK